MNILLVGGESAGLQALRAIRKAGHRLVAVLAAPSKGRFAGASVSGVAEKLGVPVWPTQLVKDAGFADTVRSEKVDLLLNVHSLFVIRPEVLTAPRIGAFNLHPGPLPRYAGLHSPSWAIYRGEKSHGVTLHWMAPKIDAGPIAYQALFGIEGNDTGLSLALKCVRAGIPLIETLLRTANEGADGIPRIDQDLDKREYFGATPPEGGYLRWDRPAQAVCDFVRACDYRPFPPPWGHPRAPLGNCEVGIVSARRTGRPTNGPPGAVGRVGETGVEIACLGEWLTVTEVVVNGRYEKAGEIFDLGSCLPSPPSVAK